LPREPRSQQREEATVVTESAAVPVPASGAAARAGDGAQSPGDATLPRHIAIIMDGNGRWAQAHGQSRQAGHEAGAENIRTVIRRFAELGVPYLTLYAFSTENWGRPKQEVGWLMRILGRVLRREVGELHKNGIRVRHLGRIDVLAKTLQRQVREAEELTANNTRMTVCVAFNYGGRAEIVDAVRRLVADGVPAERIDEQAIAERLYTAGLPDPDLIIRTGGEMRLSNFLLWQSAYAEYYATERYWPDFHGEEIDRALAAFGSRQRRFGLTPEQASR
jgi:undecaprenyl diphosphate synthase